MVLTHHPCALNFTQVLSHTLISSLIQMYLFGWNLKYIQILNAIAGNVVFCNLTFALWEGTQTGKDVEWVFSLVKRFFKVCKNEGQGFLVAQQ